MAQVVWTRAALTDLESIHDFIALESLRYAELTIEKIFSRTRVLSHFPGIGREVPEFIRPDIRELIEGNYRIIYRINRKSVSILRIHHSARDMVNRGR